jgi:hypothetical protein
MSILKVNQIQTANGVIMANLNSSGANIGFQLASSLAPAFSAYNNATQSISNNTLTKINFQVESFDTNGNFDSTTNYRFTPTVAGYYQINAGLNMATGSGIASVAIYKNGAEWQSGSQMPLNGSYSVRPVVSTVIYFNGSSDYVEIYGLQISGGNLNVGTNSTIATWFTGAMIRSA